MASIHQFQRRAIESLRPGDDLPADFSAVDFALGDGRPLYYLGASEGIGTCADIHGMWVLVLGTVCPKPNVPVGNRLSVCRYAVLLRDPTADERQKFYQGSVVCLECVERLSFVEHSGGIARFALTEKSACYVSTFG